MTSLIATTRSSLQVPISTACGQFVAITVSVRGEVLLNTPNKDDYSGSSILLLMVVERKLRMGGNEYASYAVPNDATVDILLSI